MLQMFHLDVSKVDQALHMLQWRQWSTNSGQLQGFGSYLMPSSYGTPRPLLFSLSSPFPSLNLVVAI
jgi:hypothetical protein